MNANPLSTSGSKPPAAPPPAEGPTAEQLNRVLAIQQGIHRDTAAGHDTTERSKALNDYLVNHGIVEQGPADVD